MYKYECTYCGCSLDPGEGRLCEDCLAKREQNRKHKVALDSMLLAADYTQIRVEDFV